MDINEDSKPESLASVASLRNKVSPCGVIAATKYMPSKGNSQTRSEAWAIIPAGGSGSRFSNTQDKLLSPLAGTPVLTRTVQAFVSTPHITGIILVASAQNLPLYQVLISEAFPQSNIHFVTGGSTRRDSVYQGLLALPESAEIAVIHDAARPLITPELIEKSIAAVQQDAPGAIIAVPMVDTVKRTAADSAIIQQTLDRNTLWRAQTPQTFKKAAILQAHQKISADTPITDDAQLMELAGLGPIQLIPGTERNLKITGPKDIWLAEAFLNKQMQHQ